MSAKQKPWEFSAHPVRQHWVILTCCTGWVCSFRHTGSMHVTQKPWGFSQCMQLGNTRDTHLLYWLSAFIQTHTGRLPPLRFYAYNAQTSRILSASRLATLGETHLLYWLSVFIESHKGQLLPLRFYTCNAKTLRIISAPRLATLGDTHLLYWLSVFIESHT